MSYPFSGTQYAQANSDQYGHGRQYHDPYDRAAYDGGYDSGSAPSNDAYYSRNGYGSYDNAHPDEAYPYADQGRDRSSAMYDDRYDDMRAAEHRTDDAPSPTEKLHNEGNSPYYVKERDAAGMGDGTYNVRSGNSIWLPEQKRAMQQRSAPAKICRVFFCTIFTAIFIIIAVVSLFIIFARPPNFGIGNTQNPSAESVGLDGNTLTFNGSIDFIISNPNSIGSELTIDAKVYDAVDKTQAIGEGSLTKEPIAANANTTITFPYRIQYDPTVDAQQTILRDLVQKCGLTGSGAQQLTLELDIGAKIRLLSIDVPVSFTRAINMDCPVPPDILRQIAGGNIQSIIGQLGRRGRDVLSGERSEL